MGKRENYSKVKPKLPRKRKKAAIKAQGRKWYNYTIRLYRITQRSRKFYEPVCKFWVNTSIQQRPYESGGKLVMIPTPTRYW